jgi:hypothetical protein
MTVQELIDILHKVDDKTRIVAIETDDAVIAVDDDWSLAVGVDTEGTTHYFTLVAHEVAR